MSTYEVMDANRKIKRDIQKVFGDDFLKILTEIVLNSDDSYNRMPEKKGKHYGDIVIKLNRRTRVLRFLDYAEGMSYQDMKKIFRFYGGDVSKFTQNKQIRGLFGQGASDVLFLSAFHQYPSYIISIKDKEASKCSFIFDGKKSIHLQELPNVERVRKETGILKNGTLVVFGLGESVRLPKQKEIKEKMEGFYMLRTILANPNRKVSFYDGDLKHRLSSKAYLFDQEFVLIKDKQLHFSFDEEMVVAKLTVYKVKKEDPRMILVKDEHGVIYEESLFGLEGIHGARELAGELVIPSLSTILRNYLNKEKPEEILRDSRDGFDRRHRFTSAMVKEVSKELETIIKEQRTNQEGGFSLKQHPKMVEALRSANQYFDGLSLSPIYEVKEELFQEETIKFARDNITITEGKRYGLHLYVNPFKIGKEDIVYLEMEDNPYVRLSTKELSLQELNQISGGTLIKHIGLIASKVTKQGIQLKARIKGEETRVEIHVVKMDILYPENGLAFKDKKKTLVAGNKSHIKLYFDTAFIPLKSSVLINMHYESMLFPESLEIYTSKKHLITKDIGVLKIPLHSHQYEEKIRLSATSFDIVTKAEVEVKSKEETAFIDGLIHHIELVFDQGHFQSRVDEEENTLQINGAHLINQRNLGNLRHKDPKNPRFDENELAYLYELIASESSKRYVIEKYRASSKVLRPSSLFDEIQEHKTKIYKMLVGKEDL